MYITILYTHLGEIFFLYRPPNMCTVSVARRLPRSYLFPALFGIHSTLTVVAWQGAGYHTTQARSWLCIAGLPVSTLQQPRREQSSTLHGTHAVIPTM